MSDGTLRPMNGARYYTEPMTDTFASPITEIDERRVTVVLSETCFYPEGGGQPADRGTLAGVSVTDVQKDDAGVIRHTLSHPLAETVSVGDRVSGVIDWPHRWDYMQQHTGQHVLSGALMAEADAATVSVHQGEELTTIEVDREEISPDRLSAVERRANEIIRDDRALRTFWVDSSELEGYRLRRPTSRTGRIRLVEIEEFDLVACGGVHLPRTGMLNLIHLVAVERIRGRLRLAFKIGDRALEDYAAKDEALQRAAFQVSAQPADVPDRLAALISEVQEAGRAHRHMAARIAELELERRLDGTPAHAAAGIVLEGEDQEVFSAIVEHASEEPERRLCVLNRTDSGLHWGIVIGAAYPFPQQELRDGILGPLGAKGGGKPPVWRGIIKDPDDDSADRFRDAFIRVADALHSRPPR